MSLSSAICEGMIRELPALTKEDRLRGRVDCCIAWIDRIILETLAHIVEHQGFRDMESIWRGLFYLAQCSGNDPIVQIHIMNLSKPDLEEDFANSASVDQSGLFHLVYESEYNTYGGEPYAAVLMHYEFQRRPDDVRLLRQLSLIGMLAHCPFIGTVGPSFFGLEDWAALPAMSDLNTVFETSEYNKWRAFQHEDSSRYLALMLNDFLVRVPYHGCRISMQGSVLTFDEKRWDKEGKGYCFSSPIFALGTVLARAFLRTGWCTEIFGAGLQRGLLQDIPLAKFQFGVGAGNKITTEFLVTSRLEHQLSEHGFIALVHHRVFEAPCILSCRTVQALRNYRRDAQAMSGWNISARLSFLFLVSRLAQYLKVHQRQNLGSLREASDIQYEMDRWLQGLVTSDTSPTPETRSRRPLRGAAVEVKPHPDDPGKFQIHLWVQPHYQLENVNIQLVCSTTFVVSPEASQSGTRSGVHA